MAFNFGRTTTTTSSGSATDGVKYLGAWTAPATGYVTALKAYLHVPSGTIKCRMGMYGPAATLLTSTPRIMQGNAEISVSNTSAAWKSVDVDSLPEILYNNVYWIACQTNGAIEIHRNTTGGTHKYGSDAYYDGLQSTVYTLSGGGSYSYCFYATCVEKRSLAGALIATGLLEAQFQPAEQLHGALTAQGVLTAALRVGGHLHGSLIGQGEAEAYLRRGLPIKGALTAQSLMTAILRASGRFWETPPRHVTLCPRCGAPQVDSLMTRCSACGQSFQNRY